MVGAMGTVILAVSLLATLAVFGSYVAAYAAHCFLVVIEQTAAGSEEVVWPDEPFLDWLWKTVYLAWLGAAWLVPLWLLWRHVLTPPVGQPPSFLFLAVGLLWLLAPLSLLSSLSATTWLVVLRPGVVGRLLCGPGALLLFFALSGLLVGATAALIYTWLAGWERLHGDLLLRGSTLLAGIVAWWAWLLVLPVTAAFVAAALLWYARLMGRLAWLMNGATRPQLSPSQPPLPPPVAPQPRSVLPVPDGELYQLAEDDAPPVVKEMAALAEGIPQLAARVRSTSAEAEAGSGAGPTALLYGVAGFPWYRQSLTAFCWLTFDALCLLILTRILVTIWPF